MYNKDVVYSAVTRDFMASVSIQCSLNSNVRESDLEIEAYQDGFILVSVKANYVNLGTSEKVFRLFKYDNIHNDVFYITSFLEHEVEKAFEAFNILT